MNGLIKVMINSFMAGAFIALASTLYMFTGGITGSILFSLGIMLVLLFRSNLFTGMIGFVKLNEIRTAVPMMSLVYAFNALGVLVVMLLQSSDTITHIAGNIVSMRLKMAPEEVFLKSAVCGAVMYTCVRLFSLYKFRSFMMIPMLISWFILLGLPHCIADLAYIFATKTFYWTYILEIIGNSTGALLFGSILGKDL